MASKDHKLIYEFSGSRNLYTTPLDVTDLDGDSWDYFVELEHILGYRYIQMRCNNDAASNYRRYYMQGNVSTADAGVNESENLIYLGANNSDPIVSRIHISGDSSSERYLDILFSGKQTNTQIVKQSSYWKNNADNLTQLNFLSENNTTMDFTLRIYQVPKRANLDNYDLVEVVDFASRDLNANPIVFSGLDGDSDGEYLVEYKSDRYCELNFNSDTGSKYVHQDLYNNGGGLGAINETLNSVESQRITFGIEQQSTLFKINATSGRKRLVTFSTSEETASGYEQQESACWWDNEVDNLTQIDLSNDGVAGSATGQVKLYKRKSNRTIDPVPMMTVVEHDINNVDFSNGITITGIEGDRIDGAVKIECIGLTGSPEFRIRPNNDVGTNYVEQRLDAGGSSVSSSAITTGTSIQLCDPSSGEYASSEYWLYPKSGQNRPMLWKWNDSPDRLVISGGWWNNSVDELSSMKIYASNTNAITGKIRISVPKGTRQATGSFAVTVN